MSQFSQSVWGIKNVAGDASRKLAVEMDVHIPSISSGRTETHARTIRREIIVKSESLGLLKELILILTGTMLASMRLRVELGLLKGDREHTLTVVFTRAETLEVVAPPGCQISDPGSSAGMLLPA